MEGLSVDRSVRIINFADFETQIDPMPLLMKMIIFLLDDSRNNGRNAFVTLMVPKTLTLKPWIHGSRSSLEQRVSAVYISDNLHLRQLICTAVWVQTSVVYEKIDLARQLLNILYRTLIGDIQLADDDSSRQRTFTLL